MKRKFNRTQRNYIIVGLCAILVIMGVGYAAFSSQLKILGTSNISSDFAVRITSITPNNIVGNAKDVPGVTTHTDATATFGTTLELPGDSIIYDVVIENQGTIDATLKTIIKTDASNSAIIFETSGVTEGDELRVGESTTMKVKVTYNPNVTSQPDNLESTLKVTLDYEQSEGTIVNPPMPSVITSDDLKALAVTEGDGLYADGYEPGKYTYKGANPNNYITFNNEAWRIISVSSDGTLKIIRNESIGDRAFDSGNSNDWETSDIKSYLNDTYLPTITTNQDKIVSHTWSIGEIIADNNDLFGQINDENGIQSQNSSVGMITVSEYLRANTNKVQCENINLNNTNSSTCGLTNWMYAIVISNESTWAWTLSLDESNGPLFYISSMFGKDPAGFINANNRTYAALIFPVVYLTSTTELSGSGTQSDPYIIIN